MRPCTICGHHILMQHRTCTNCEQPTVASMSKTGTIALGLLLGLGTVGCGDKDDDTSASDTAVEEPASEPDMAAEYGVPTTQSE